MEKIKLKANEYFHYSTKEYKAGDIISPSNYLVYNTELDAIIEFLIEDYRVKHLPNEVSRHNCIFGYTTEDALIGAVKRKQHTAEMLYFYKIKATEKTPVSKNNFIANTFLTKELDIKKLSYKEMLEIGKAFWESEVQYLFKEVLIPVDCEIVSQLWFQSHLSTTSY